MLLIGCLLFTDTGVDTKLLFTRGIFVDVGGHERGQTFRPVVKSKIQARCNSKTHVHHCNSILDFI